jgi:hypothetical protein
MLESHPYIYQIEEIVGFMVANLAPKQYIL